jgi:hypothetical protein
MICNRYELSRVYRLKCGGCPHIYIGQTGLQISSAHPEYGTQIYDMQQTLKVLHFQYKGRMMNMLESCRIYETHKQGLQLKQSFN